MIVVKVDPFKQVRKNAHIWRGEKSLLWYNERLDGSFSFLALYDFGDKKCRLFLEVGGAQKVEFKNDELPSDQFEHLKKEIEVIERLLINPEPPWVVDSKFEKEKGLLKEKKSIQKSTE